MPYLIDGNNLIGHLSYLELADPRSKHRLVAQLFIFQRVTRKKITLVFDGAPDSELCGEKFRSKKFLILYPDREQTADTIIKERIENQSDPRHLYVVSSDGEIKRFAKMSRARVLTCEEFGKHLKRSLKKYRESNAEKKVETRLTPLEVDHWMDIFGKSDE
jgi:predicted RNA-binding protein with PIN domain